MGQGEEGHLQATGGDVQGVRKETKGGRMRSKVLKTL